MNKFIVLILLFLSVLTNAQTTVKGRVLDDNTQQAVEFATISFLNESGGTTTDINGYFNLYSESAVGHIIISFIGYLSDTIAIKPNSFNSIQVSLKSASTDLNEIEIVASKYSNPNKDLFKKIIAHKSENDASKLSAFECEIYNKVQLDISNVNENLKDSKVKSLSFIFDMIDSTEDRSNLFLPIFIAETVSDYYYKTSPKQAYEKIKASKISGIKNESVSILLGNTYTDFNIYDNFISGFEREFVSPVSDMGWLYYKYEILDTLYIGPYLSYEIKYSPRRKQEATFYGTMWVEAESYAISKIKMTLSEDANVNLINHLTIDRNYIKVDGKWLKSKEISEMELSLIRSEKLAGFYAHKTTYWKDYTINQPKGNSFYSSAEGVVIEEESSNKNDAFWNGARGERISEKEQIVYNNIDSLVNTKIYKWGERFTKMLYTGYLPLKTWEFGPYYTTYSFNSIEGKRFRFGGRTKKAFSKNWRLGAYGAYGTLDKEFKYRASVEYYFSRHPRVKISASFLHDYRQLSDSPDAFQPDNIMASLSRRSDPQYTLLDQQKITFDKEWVRGISNKVRVTRNSYKPVGNLQYLTPDNEQLNEINISTLLLAGRFAYKEKYVEGDFDRVSLGTKSPVFTYGAIISRKGVLESDYDFVKAFFQYRDRWYLGPFGYFDCIIDASKIWGEIPYPILLQHPGNSSYYFDDYAFNLMNPGEFVSDQYISIKNEYHLAGMFLNKVPLIRKFKWREIIYSRAIIGSLEYDHEKAILFPGTMTSLEGKPYWEVGIGVENIFKILRLDYIWRITHLDKPNAPKSGLMGGIVFVF